MTSYGDASLIDLYTSDNFFFLSSIQIHHFQLIKELI